MADQKNKPTKLTMVWLGKLDIEIEQASYDNDRQRGWIPKNMTFDEYVSHYLGWQKVNGNYYIS